MDERSALHQKLSDAVQAVDAAWGYANRTPSLHDLSDRISQVMADLIAIKRIA